MNVEELALLAGILFILIAVVGGGFTIKEVTIPRVPGWARVAALLIGTLFVIPYFLGNVLFGPPEPPRGDDAQMTAIYADSTPDRSVHGVRLNQFEARAEHQPPRVNDRIQISFTLQNVGDSAVSFQETFVAARNPGEENRDFGHGHQRLVLEPNDTVLVKANIIVEQAGVWQFWPCYLLSGGTEADYCPPRWRAVPIQVVE